MMILENRKEVLKICFPETIFYTEYVPNRSSARQHSYTHSYLHTYIRTPIRACMHTSIRLYIHTFMLPHVHIYIRTPFLTMNGKGVPNWFLWLSSSNGAVAPTQANQSSHVIRTTSISVKVDGAEFPGHRKSDNERKKLARNHPGKASISNIYRGTCKKALSTCECAMLGILSVI